MEGVLVESAVFDGDQELLGSAAPPLARRLNLEAGLITAHDVNGLCEALFAAPPLGLGG